MEVPVFATVVVGILGLAVDSGRAEKRFALLTRRLAASPSNAALQNAILTTIRKSRFAHLSEAASQKVYKIALHALEASMSLSGCGPHSFTANSNTPSWAK